MLLESTTTNANGNYLFDGLDEGDYVVQIPPANFNVGGALEGMFSSTGNGSAADPDNDHNIDDNGTPLAGYGVVSKAITLTFGGEPVTDDGLPNTNLTLDFGMATESSVRLVLRLLTDRLTISELSRLRFVTLIFVIT